MMSQVPISNASSVPGFHKDVSASSEYQMLHEPSDGDDGTRLALFEEKYTKVSSKPIYEGANGVIYKGSKKGGKDLLVIKTIKRHEDQTRDVYKKLVTKEYVNMKMCSNKNIMPIIDMCEDQVSEEYSVILPYYPKGDVLDYFCMLRRNKATVSSNLKDLLFKQIVKGVAYLHKMNIVHRDLKPENFLIDNDGVIKISDFGYSLNLNPVHYDLWAFLEENPHKVWVGTNSFKAPELYRGRQENFDLDKVKEVIDFKKLDSWSLGIVYINITLMSKPWASANASEDKSFLKFAENYPSSVKQLALLMQQLDDRHYKSAVNPALSTFQKLHYDARYEIFGLLHPDIEKRSTVEKILLSNWLSQVYANPKELIELGRY